MNKTDFANQFDFDELQHATKVEIHFKDGATKSYGVLNYWDTTNNLVDAMECWDPTAPQDAAEYIRFPIFYVPDPDIASIRIVQKSEKPNHGGHPEIGIIFPRIDELFIKKQQAKPLTK